PPARRLDHHLDHAPMLVVAEGGRLAGGAAGHDAVRSLRHVELDQLAELGLVDLAAAEGSHQGNDRALERGTHGRLLDLGWAPGLAPTNPVGTARARCRSLAAPRSLALARRMPPDSSTRSKRVQGAPGPLARGDRHLVGVRALVRLARAVESRHRVA